MEVSCDDISMELFQGAKALEEFIDNIKNDPDKASNMPRDGTVHELTNHVCDLNFLSFIDLMGCKD